MVIPSWDSFQKNNQNIEQEEEQEQIQEIPGEVEDQLKPEGKKPEWGNFQSPETFQGDPDPTADESWFDYGLRNAAANASRVVEQVAGRYGNIEKFGKDVLVNHPQVGGLVPWAISELMGAEKWEKMIRESTGREQLFATSSQLKEASHLLTGGYTKAKTPGEERFQGFTEDVGSLLSGGRRPTLYNNVVTPVVANVAKEITKEVGFGDDKANIVKTAVWLPMMLAGNVNGNQYASDLMNRGRQGIPNTVQMNVPRFTNRLNQVANSPMLLQSDPRTALARQVLGGLRQDLANGQTNSQSLFTMYDAVNAAKRNRGMFELGRGDQAFARRAIDQVRHAVRDEIMDVGANYPQAIRDWQNGVSAWATIHRSNTLSNWVQEQAKGPYAKILTGPAAALFGVTSYGAAKAPMVALPAAAAVPAAYKTGQVLYRMQQNQPLRNYYWNALHEAGEQNLPAFISNYVKLNKGLEKSIKSTEPKSKTKEK